MSELGFLQVPLLIGVHYIYEYNNNEIQKCQMKQLLMEALMIKWHHYTSNHISVMGLEFQKSSWFKITIRDL